jgi:hypothetical protein
VDKISVIALDLLLGPGIKYSILDIHDVCFYILFSLLLRGSKAKGATFFFLFQGRKKKIA